MLVWHMSMGMRGCVLIPPFVVNMARQPKKGREGQLYISTEMEGGERKTRTMLEYPL